MRSGIGVLAICGIVSATWCVASAQDGSYNSGRLPADGARSQRTTQYASPAGQPATQQYAQAGAQQELVPDPDAWANEPADNAPATQAGPLTGGQLGPSRYVRGKSNTGRQAPQPISGVKNLKNELFGDHTPSGVVQASTAEQESSEPQAGSYPQQGANPAQATVQQGAPQTRTIPTTAAQRRAAANTARPNGITPAAPRQGAAQRIARRPAGANRGNAPSAVVHAEHQRPTGQTERGQIQQVARRRGIQQTGAQGTGPSITAGGPMTAPLPPEDEALGAEGRQPMLPARDTLTTSTDELKVAAGLKAIQSSLIGPQAPNISVRWAKRSDINVGQECDLDLIVKNTGKSPAREIAVDAFFPTSARLIAADPQPTEQNDHLSWAFSLLEAGEERTIAVRIVPSVRGELATNALVRFTGSAAGTFTVEEPMLEVSTQGPKEVMVGDLASQSVTISNPGTGVASNVVIEAAIPSGLEHPRGERLMMEIGALNPGETRTVRLALAAVEGGHQVVQIEARADAGLHQTAQAEVSVIAPSLKVAITGPGLRYIGRNAEYTLTVNNDGVAASNNVRVMHRVPNGFQFVRASKGGKFEKSTDICTWFVGHLDPKESTELKIELVALEPGEFTQRVGAISEHGVRCEAEFNTQVEGTAALVLEIIDLDDPVEIGVETAYEVRVRNEGTKAASNIGVTCELPEGVELVGANGAAEHLAENNLVVFKSLTHLDPGKTALYRVHVRGKVEGNHRFRARLVSDNNKEPLIFEELTKFYAD